MRRSGSTARTGWIVDFRVDPSASDIVARSWIYLLWTYCRRARIHRMFDGQGDASSLIRYFSRKQN
jgi:hypothetical protein